MEKESHSMNQIPPQSTVSSDTISRQPAAHTTHQPAVHTTHQPVVHNQEPGLPQYEQYQQQQPAFQQQDATYQQKVYPGANPLDHQQQQPHQQAGQPGMPPQQQSGQQFQTTVPIPNLSRGPAPTDCPACGQRDLTKVVYESGNSTHAWAAGLCICLCLGCIPYLMNSLKDVQHRCGRCGVLLATWHRSGLTEVHIHS